MSPTKNGPRLWLRGPGSNWGAAECGARARAPEDASRPPPPTPAPSRINWVTGAALALFTRYYCRGSRQRRVDADLAKIPHCCMPAAPYRASYQVPICSSKTRTIAASGQLRLAPRTRRRTGLSLPRSGRSLPMQLTASMPSLKTPRTETHPPRRKTPQAAGLWLHAGLPCNPTRRRARKVSSAWSSLGLKAKLK
jgi:hypothetical protein